MTSDDLAAIKRRAEAWANASYHDGEESTMESGTAKVEAETAFLAALSAAEAKVRELEAALRLAEVAIDDCQSYRSHIHHKELSAVRAALGKEIQR